MNAKATATRPAPADAAPAEPALDALGVMRLALSEDRNLTSQESELVGKARAIADGPGEAAIMRAGEELDRAGQRRAMQAQYAASERARDQRKAFIASRDPAFRALPTWLQLEWARFDLAGARGTAEGRAWGRRLEEVTRGEVLATPDCFMPVPAERP